MPSISRAQSEAETEALRGAIQHAEKAREGQALILELRAVAHPCAHHAFNVPGLWDEIAQEYRRIGDFDAAIDARERSIAAGYRSWPDPRADIAEFHLLAGRADEAAKLYEKLRAGHPEDIWLYNHAGYAHAGVGDHENAVAWLTAGIDVGLASGDPEGVVDQLNDLRSASLAALGRGPDELTERAAGFVKSWTRPAAGTWRAPSAPGGEPRAERACEHCGFDPGVESARSPRIGGRTERPAPPPVELSVAWFPESDWTRALERWPDLTDRFAGLDHPSYCRAIQADLLGLAALAIGERLSVAPVRLDEYVPWCTDRGLDPGEPASRSHYAADLRRTGRAFPWPPGRNDPCWCASGKKYKRCCGNVTRARDEA